MPCWFLLIQYSFLFFLVFFLHFHELKEEGTFFLILYREITGLPWTSIITSLLYESVEREGEATTILGLLTERMDGLDRGRRRRTLKERLGIKGMGCCGPTWGFGRTTISVREDEEEDHEEQTEAIIIITDQNRAVRSDPGCFGPVPINSGMNLAAALAAERHFRASHEPEGTVVGPNNISGATGSVPGTPLRMSLMRLLEETGGGDCGDGREKEREGGGGGASGNDTVCCVCMGRRKGAAFIPCGHTFCRVCSRELWLNRGSCPLCNRLILEILDIF